MTSEVYTSFNNYIRQYQLFSESELALIMSMAEVKQLKKREYLLRQGSLCRHHSFVCSGTLRTYRIDDEGIEHIIDLSAAGRWVNATVSGVPFSSTPNFIDALEDTRIIQYSSHNYQHLLDTIPRFNEFNSKIIKELCDEYSDRIFMMLSLHAEQRYRAFINLYPELHERIPIYMIASYLGISRETLTRIRTGMSNTIFNQN